MIRNNDTHTDIDAPENILLSRSEALKFLGRLKSCNGLKTIPKHDNKYFIDDLSVLKTEIRKEYEKREK